jgi:hypothetical protein
MKWRAVSRLLTTSHHVLNVMFHNPVVSTKYETLNKSPGVRLTEFDLVRRP